MGVNGKHPNPWRRKLKPKLVKLLSINKVGCQKEILLYLQAFMSYNPSKMAVIHSYGKSLWGRISFWPSDRQAVDPIEKREKLRLKTYICAVLGYLTIFAHMPGLAV